MNREIIDHSRVRRLAFAPELLAHLACGRFEIVSNEVPETARVIGAYYDGGLNCFIVLLHDPSWQSVVPGNEIPIHPSPVIRRIEEEARR